MRNIALTGFRNSQDVELKHPPSVYGAKLERDAETYLHFLYADDVWAAATVKRGFDSDHRRSCKRVMRSGAKQVRDDHPSRPEDTEDRIQCHEV